MTSRERSSGAPRRRWAVVGVVLVLVVVAGLAGVLARPRGSGGALDPRSAAPQGALAVAQVLQRHGVAVERVGRVDDAVAAAGPGTTLLVAHSDVLPPDRLADLAGTGADLVLVEPDAPVLDVLAPDLVPAGTAAAEVRPARCGDADARAAGSALAGGLLFTATATRSPDNAPTVCFPDPQDPETGSYAVTTASGRDVTVLGQAGVFTNEHLDEEGNAALAVRTLGEHERLVWLMASPLDTAADDDVTAADLLPSWVPWVAVQLMVVALLAIAWRARRLGPLVPEPLPVVVRSAETAEGRASLYRAARARTRAAAVLRAAALRRLAARLGLPAAASSEQVVEAVAGATGRDVVDVRRVLLGPVPDDDASLVTLADELDALVGHPRAIHANREANRT